MHARTEYLLSFRDGLPVPAEVGEHIRGCGVCLAEVERLSAVRDGLCRLPEIEPPTGVFERAVAATETPAPGWPGWIVPVAGIAATLLVAVAVIATLPQPPRPVEKNVAVAEFMQQSEELEETLRAFYKPALTDAHTAGTIAALEDQLAVIDYGLSLGRDDLTPAQHQQLWRGRVELMNSLVSMRYAQTVAYTQER